MFESNMNHRFLKLTVLLLAVFAVAQAGPIGFTGPYDPSLWSLSNPVGGSVDSSGAPASVTITGGNGGSAGTTSWTIGAPAGGTVSFDWSYVSYDVDGPFFDPAGYLVNGSPTQLSNNGGSASQSGSTSFSVAPGDIFGFYVYTTDGVLGPGALTPSNFSAPDSLPEPATWLLVGIPLVLVGLRRRLA
jgi:hypothetical protein